MLTRRVSPGARHRSSGRRLNGYGGLTFQAPALTNITGDAQISCNVVDLHALKSVSNLTIEAPDSSAVYDLSSLSLVSGNLTINAPDPSPVPDLNSLTNISGLLSVTFGAGSAGSFSLSAATSVGGVQFSGSFTTLSLPLLTKLGNGNVSTQGAFQSPLLTTVENGNLAIALVNDLDLSSLANVNGTLNISLSSLVTLNLPELATVTRLLLGCSEPPACIVTTDANRALTSVAAPKLTNGKIMFCADPVLPKCQADALIAQTGSGGICLVAGSCP